MNLDSKKELTTVHYSAYSVKVIHKFKFAPNAMTFPLHWHDRIELLRIWEGRLILTCSDHHCTLLPGDVALISPKMLHSGTAGDEGVVYDVIMFDPTSLLNETAPAAQYILPLCQGKYIFDPLVQNPQITARLDSIVAAHRQESSNHPLQVIGELYDLVGLLYKNCVIRETAALPTQKHFDRTIDYINEHYAENISSASLSQMFGYDESYFCRKFKKQTGLTVMKYIQILRIEKARKLLVETQLPVQDISALCGFSDTAYFTNCFKALCHVTPTRLRETAKQTAQYSKRVKT